MERRGYIDRLYYLVNQRWEESVDKAKPFSISKRLVWEAYKRVKANSGAAGVDEESISDFQKALKDNLYKIWNRMSSGSYFPPPVRMVSIPKSNGGQRVLGIPTVSDRIAQTVCAMYLEPNVEPYFHPDSYGYRPGKSAIEAVGVARRRCWQYNWVLDLEIKGFFDNLDHELLIRAVRKHTECKWVIVYIERWLKAAVQGQDGALVARDKGVPQGGVISPLLSNLFLHYAFDEWMHRKYRGIPFERYCDDIIVHCSTEEQALNMRTEVGERLAECRLELHPQKTQIVYCKDEDRRGKYPNETFDFLGFTFRPRRSKNRWGKYFINFSPAVSSKAAKIIRSTMRSWRVHLRSDKSLEDISRMFGPILRGWINYYGSYYKSALYPIFKHFNHTLMRWATRKYKRLRGHRRRASYWLRRIACCETCLFPHWRLGVRP